MYCSHGCVSLRFRSSVLKVQDDMRRAFTRIGCDAAAIRAILSAFQDPSTHIASGFRFEQSGDIVYVTYYVPLIDKELPTMEDIVHGANNQKKDAGKGWSGAAS